MRIQATIVTSLTLVGLLLMAAACAKLPTTEIGATESAIDAARDAEAATYAPDEWNAAQQAMTAARSEIATQESKFAPLRSYSESTKLLSTAASLAQSAEAAGNAGSQKALEEAEAALTAVHNDLDAAAALIAELEGCPRKPKGFAQDLELLKGSLQGLTESVPEIESALAEGQLLEATSLARSAQEEISTFVVDLGSAKTKINC